MLLPRTALVSTAVTAPTGVSTASVQRNLMLPLPSHDGLVSCSHRGLLNLAWTLGLKFERLFRRALGCVPANPSTNMFGTMAARKNYNFTL